MSANSEGVRLGLSGTPQLRALEVTEANRRLAVRWLVLGVAALSGAGLFAVVLVLSRAPFVHALFPDVDLFRLSLVVHVDLSVLVWFLAFGGVVWSLAHTVNRWLAQSGLGLAAAGTLLLVLSPFMGAAIPSLNNYVPVLQQPWFLAGLIVFGFGVALMAVSSAREWLAPGSLNVLQVGSVTASIATVVTLVSLVIALLQLRSHDFVGHAYYELLFWAPGHTLQFVYTQLLMVALLGLALGTNLRIALSPRSLMVLLWLGLVPVFLAPVFQLTTDIGGIEQRTVFTQLMQYGGLIPALPIGAAVLWACWVGSPTPLEERPARAALHASLLLFAVGGVVGFLIRDVNTVIPAHYHGSIAGVTMAFMGLTYHLLPRLGFASPTGWMARWQPWVYAAGQLLHVAGLALSGYLGIQRKTAGAAQGLDSITKMLTMGVMGIGGLLAIIGGVLFVVVVIVAMYRRAAKAEACG